MRCHTTYVHPKTQPKTLKEQVPSVNYMCCQKCQKFYCLPLNAVQYSVVQSVNKYGMAYSVFLVAPSMCENIVVTSKN